MSRKTADFETAFDELIIGRSFVEHQKYYEGVRGRYRETFRRIAGLDLSPGATHLDIGGGQFALLTQRLLAFESYCGDVIDSARDDLAGQGITLQHIDLFRGEFSEGGPYDLITLCEVIEHIPKPPYIVLKDLRRILKPGGIILMTTPNGYRIRNLLYMVTNRQVLGIYRYPEKNQALGHQHEYTLWQMNWQMRAAELEPLFIEYYQPGLGGHSFGAQLAHLLTLPFTLVPHFRNGLVMAARNS